MGFHLHFSSLFSMASELEKKSKVHLIRKEVPNEAYRFVSVLNISNLHG